MLFLLPIIFPHPSLPNFLFFNIYIKKNYKRFCFMNFKLIVILFGWEERIWVAESIKGKVCLCVKDGCKNNVLNICEKKPKKTVRLCQCLLNHCTVRLVIWMIGGLIEGFSSCVFILEQQNFFFACVYGNANLIIFHWLNYYASCEYIASIKTRTDFQLKYNFYYKSELTQKVILSQIILILNVCSWVWLHFSVKQLCNFSKDFQNAATACVPFKGDMVRKKNILKIL